MNSRKKEPEALAVKSRWCYSEIMINGVKHSNGHKIEGIVPSNEPAIPGSKIEESTVKFDLEAVLSAVRPLRSVVPVDAHSAGTLGTEREGNAVLIDESGLFLTIGYLVVEATDVFIGGPDGTTLNAHPVGYDHETGFGLIRSVEVPAFAPIQVGDNSNHFVKGSRAIVSSFGGSRNALDARVVDRRLFTGSWEYMVESAIFTAPLHPSWSGAALIDPENGSLCGIGSLLIQGPSGENEDEQGNMFVPIELLPPIIDDLLKNGKRAGSARPWLGVYVSEALGHLVIGSIFEGGPAANAGVQHGDILEQVEDKPVETLEEFYRELWSTGEAGTSIKLGIIRGSASMDIFVRSGDRREYYKQPRRH